MCSTCRFRTHWTCEAFTSRRTPPKSPSVSQFRLIPFRPMHGTHPGNTDYAVLHLDHDLVAHLEALIVVALDRYALDGMLVAPRRDDQPLHSHKARHGELAHHGGRLRPWRLSVKFPIDEEH